MTDAAGCEPHRPSSRHWRRRLVQATAVRRSHSSCYYYYYLQKPRYFNFTAESTRERIL